MDEQGTAPARGDVYRRILQYMAPFWRGITGMVVLGLFGSSLAVLQPWVIKLIIDGVLLGEEVALGPLHLATGTTGEQLGAVTVLAVVYFFVIVVGVFANAGAVYVAARVALQMIHRLRSTLVAHMRTLSLRFHASQSIGDSIWRAINDARSIQEVVLYGVRAFSVPAFRLLFMVVLMLVLDPLLTVAALAIMPALVFTIRRLTTKIQDASMASRSRMAELTGLLERSLVGIRAVQVFGQETSEQERFEDTSLRFVRAQLRFRTWEQALNIATVALTGVGSAAVLLLAARRVVDGSLTIGSLWIFVSYMQSLYQMLNELMFIYGPFQDAVVGVGRAFQVLDEVPEITESEDAVDKDRFERDIRLRDVWLEYETGRPVLKGIDLVVQRGEKVAIVGETGSGKTTLLSAIPRLYEVSRGGVEIDGVDVRDLRIRSLRSLISMVPQEPLLFSATVKQNILYGRPDAPDEDVEAAAAAARADGFVRALPSSWETEVGERGVKLSTGQQQRISIARAFLKDAPVLLLDEPTSALDLRTESDFLEGLEALMEGRTVFIVAHRLSTIRTADRILVMDAGQIVESGTHDELLALGGRYRDLYLRQFGEPDVEAVG